MYLKRLRVELLFFSPASQLRTPPKSHPSTPIVYQQNSPTCTLAELPREHLIKCVWALYHNWPLAQQWPIFLPFGSLGFSRLYSDTCTRYLLLITRWEIYYTRTPSSLNITIEINISNYNTVAKLCDPIFSFWLCTRICVKCELVLRKKCTESTCT